MRKGFAIIRDSGAGLTINCEDFDVEFFNGSDYEFEYSFDAKNREKLNTALRLEGKSGTLEKMIKEYFGECLDKVPFTAFCMEHCIEYGFSSWIS